MVPFRSLCCVCVPTGSFLLFSDLLRTENSVRGSIYPDSSGSSPFLSRLLLPPPPPPRDTVLPATSVQVPSAPHVPKPPWGWPPTLGAHAPESGFGSPSPSPPTYPLTRFHLLVSPCTSRGVLGLLSEVGARGRTDHMAPRSVACCA